MATPIQEPNDIPSGEITDANAGNYAVVVYKKDNDGAGLKKLGLAPWKQFLGFNSHKVNNVASWVGVPPNYYDVDADQEPPDQTLVNKVNQIRDNAGVSDQPQGSGYIPLATRVDTLENTVGTPTSGGVLDGTTVCAKVEDNSAHIDDIETFLGDSSSASGANNVSGRLQSVEEDVSTLQTEVETSNTGLLARATAIESILGTPSSGSVIVPGSNSVCQQVEHNTGEIEELWNNIGGGGGGGSSSLTSRIETLEQDMPTKADLTDLATEFDENTNYSIGDYVIYQRNLYRFTSAHSQGDWNSSEVTNALTVGSELGTKQNSTLSTAVAGQTTVENALSSLDTKSSDNTTNIGTLSNLSTTEKTNLVGAVNEVNGNIGTLSSLTTTAKTSTVAAINEIDGIIGNESNLTTDDTNSLVGAINSLVTNRGTMNSLETSAKTDLVSAINEVVGTTENLSKNKASLSSMANNFSTDTSYHTGDYVDYEGSIYRFTADHSGAWSISDVIEVKITDEIKTNNNSIATINDTLNAPTTGVISKIGTLEQNVETNTTNISAIQTWVGDRESSAGDGTLSGRMASAESDISTLKQTASSAYVLMGTITENITPSSSGWDWANMKTGWTYNVNPASGDTVDIQVPGASSSQTFYKGANLAWIKKEDAPSIPETYGYFDELGTTFDLKGIEDRIDVVENDIGDLQDDVTDLQNRFKTTYFPTVWDSTNLTGTYLIIGNNSGKTGGFIGVFSYGTLTGGLHTDIGTDVFGTTTGVNFFNLNSQTLMVSALTGINVTAVKLS